MQGKSDGVNRVHRSFKDAETLKREELHRRRLLRLEQVRQQSKDVASLVRQKVHSEREKQLGLVQDRVNARTHKWQVRKLKELQGEYNKTVQNVGKSHADAASQPNEEAAQREEAENILSAAQKRGQEALNRLKEEEKARRRANDERRFQLLNVRAVEEARSAAIVALPCPESTVGIKSIPTKASVCIVAPPPKTSGPSKTNMPEWPKRLWSQQALPLGIIDNQCNNDQGDSSKTTEKKESEAYDADLDSLPVSSHGDSYHLKKPLDDPQHFPQTTSISNRLASVRDPEAIASNHDVKVYDYSSCYQSQYGKTSGIVAKVESAGKINAKEAADKCMLTSDSKCKPISAQREQQRGREALQRVQAQRDYKQFMGSLSLLAKQNAALSSCGAAPEKPWIQINNQENQLKLAVENLLQDAEVNPCHRTLEADSVDTPDGSLIVSHFGDTPGSAPRLNVGLWRPLNTPTEQEDSLKVDSSPSDSIIVAPPSNVVQSLSDAHQENSERESALRSLVQRINDERHSLLLSRQQPLVVSKAAQDINKDIEIRNLEEKVLDQRKQLKVQRSEVKRLGDSMVAPECVNTLLEKDEGKSSPGTSCTHESIIIEQSDLSPNSSSNSLLPENHLKRKGKMSGEDGSFSKDALFYNMDVSLSSLIMDQTESSSSGSKSLSLHGVQVLVKVRGTEEGVGGSRLMSNFDEENGRAKVKELLSGGENLAHEHEDGSKHIDMSCISMKQVEKTPSQKKVKEPVLKKTNKKESKPLSEKPAKASQRHPNSQELLEKKITPNPEISSKKISKDGSRKKTRKKSSQSGAEMVKKATKEEVEMGKKIAEGTDINVAERTQEKLQEDPEMQDHLTSTSTSYLSPPDKVLSSLTEDIKTLMALAQRNILPQSGTTSNQAAHNRPLVSYINRLLAMSRESIDRLNVSCSEVSTPSSGIFKSSGVENVTNASLTDNTSLAVPTEGQVLPSKILCQDHADDRSNLQESIHDESKRNVCHTESEEWLLHSALSDQGALTDMTRQCHEKISALTKMIEEVRRQAVVNSSTEGDSILSADHQSRSTLHLDSTAYMSPPPHVIEWADVPAPAQIGNDTDSRMSLDPYSNAVVQLLADVQNHMSSQGTEMPEPLTATFSRSPQDNSSNISGHTELNLARPKPPVAFWRNIERCNAMSPTEPHELSTILELGTTLHESIGSHETAPVSPAQGLSSSSTPGTPPDVIAELMRRNLLTSPFAWAKKIENAPRQSSGSSSPMKNSVDSDLSSRKTGAGQSDISASRETNTVSFQSQNSSSNGSKDWKTNILMSPVDLYSSADEVEGDFRRMGIGWVGAMLRKTKEAGALSTTSSSDGTPMKIDNPNFKEVFCLPDEDPILSSSVTVAIRQGRGHSTPIKHPSDLSSSGSHLV